MTMRAKFLVTEVEKSGDVFETISMMAVSEKPFDAEGASEDNSFARYTPSGELKIGIQNPALIGQIKEGEKYYLDFTKVEAPAQAAPEATASEAPAGETGSPS